MDNLAHPINNLILNPLLRSPLHFIASNSFMLVSTNDDSGKTYTALVSYKRNQDVITVVARKDRGWWKHLGGGAPITLRLGDQNLTGVAQVTKLDKGALFETVKWINPTLSAQQIADLLPELVVVEIRAFAAAVAA